MAKFIKDWIAKLNSMNVVKNIIIQPIIQVIQLTTFIGVYAADKDLTIIKGVGIAAILIPISLISYILLAIVTDKLKIRQHIESEDFKRTYTWPEVFKRLDRIEQLLTKGWTNI